MRVNMGRAVAETVTDDRGKVSMLNEVKDETGTRGGGDWSEETEGRGRGWWRERWMGTEDEDGGVGGQRTENRGQGEQRLVLKKLMGAHAGRGGFTQPL